jgi:hypothetical protein
VRGVAPNEKDLPTINRCIQSIVKQVAVNPTPLFSQTQAVTIANTTAETSLDGTGVGQKTVFSRRLIPGTVLNFRAFGIHSAVSNPSLTIKVKLGSTAVISTGTFTTSNSTNAAFMLDGMVTCYTGGSSGTVRGQGLWTEASNASFGMATTTASSINTTTDQAITVTAQWGTASTANTITMTNFTVEVLD